jgi:hypothetical protein
MSDSSLKAYRVTTNPGYILEPAPRRREWMDRFGAKAPYRCLPLVLANQAGWVIRLPCAVTATWNGGPRIEDLAVTAEDPAFAPFVTTHFGGGIVTFVFPWLFRTPPAIGLWVRGPTNAARPDTSALDALVESDFNRVPFTMNWQIWDIDQPVTFAASEAICMLTPFPLDLPEQTRAEELDLQSDPQLARDLAEAAERRADSVKRNREAGEDTFERDYLRGIRADGSKREQHRTGYKLDNFE